MGISIGGSSKKSSSNFSKSSSLTSTTSQTTNSSKVNEKIIDADTKSNLLSAQSSAMNQLNYFTPERAKEDSRIAVDEAIRAVMQQYMPQMNTDVASSGMYGSTTQRLLEENLAGRAGAAAALTGLETMKDYGTLAQQAAAALTGLASQMGYKETEEVDETIGFTGTEKYSESGSGTAKESGYQAGASFGFTK